MDSSYFDTRYTPHPGRARVWKAIAEYLQRFIPPTSAVLDVGAGYCDFINQIRAAKKYAVDVNPDVARWCHPDVRFIHAPQLDAIDLPASSVDAVMMSNLLEHLSPELCSRLLDRIDEILRPEGKLLLIQPNYFYSYKTYWDDFTHVRAFSHVSLTDLLLSRGYRLLAAEKQFLPFSFKSRMPKSYWATKLYLASCWRPFAGQMLVAAQR